ncbi:hypothetical protein [Pseudorhodoferax sp. Leaf265]|uniref:hypothetical protein n=1 Tax=Pseudorhodoferax sp. Leaf265 TaxID=1736315 RepID=UPI0006F4B88F|nr:hypothetical protein [Pseudorhodoferax sp. Leaf265]KQP19308.1 hypothetical protein ASF45_24815 [Pseudorhodoferax sp. Leaf265]
MATTVNNSIPEEFGAGGTPDVVIRLRPNYDDLYEQVGNALDMCRVPLIVYGVGAPPPPPTAMTVLQAIGLPVLACNDIDLPDADLLQAYAEWICTPNSSRISGPDVSGLAGAPYMHKPTPRRKASKKIRRTS